MKNIYGETVNLTAAQKREYIALLNGPIISERKSRQYKTLCCLREKGLVRITWGWYNASKFERWM